MAEARAVDESLPPESTIDRELDPSEIQAKVQELGGLVPAEAYLPDDLEGPVEAPKTVKQ